MLNQEKQKQPQGENPIYQVNHLNLWYGDFLALNDLTFDIHEKEVTAIIGPSGCGKSTFIKTLNRMVELNTNVKIDGEIRYHDKNIFGEAIKVENLRTQVGMVFQKPNPFPKSVFENVVYGPRIHGINDKNKLMEIAEISLTNAALWDEVKDRLHKNAYDLSGGQQQRLCIARSLATEPDVLLMDEPTSALDPIATYKIEELIDQIKKEYTIVIVTHSMQQASRISDKTAFFLMGELIEYDKTEKIFSSPADQRTEDYITGRFG